MRTFPRLRPRLLATACLAAAVCLTAAPARAALIAYDGFGDGAGGVSLNGLAGGSGFGSNAWVVTNTANQNHYTDTQTNPPAPHTSNYYYPSNVPLTYASGITQHNASYNNSIGTRLLDGSSVDMGAEGQYYLSFIERDYAANPDNEGTIGLANASNALRIGYAYTDSFAVFSTTAAQAGYQGTYLTHSAFAGNTTYFIVAQITTHASSPDQILVKVYNSNTDTVQLDPSQLSGVGSGANQWTLSTTIDSSDVFDRIALTSAGVNYISLDEVRLGESWTDVTGLSVPTPAALPAGLTLLGVVGLRSRKRNGKVIHRRRA